MDEPPGRPSLFLLTFLASLIHCGKPTGVVEASTPQLCLTAFTAWRNSAQSHSPSGRDPKRQKCLKRHIYRYSRMSMRRSASVLSVFMSVWESNVRGGHVGCSPTPRTCRRSSGEGRAGGTRPQGWPCSDTPHHTTRPAMRSVQEGPPTPVMAEGPPLCSLYMATPCTFLVSTSPSRSASPSKAALMASSLIDRKCCASCSSPHQATDQMCGMAVVVAPNAARSTPPPPFSLSVPLTVAAARMLVLIMVCAVKGLDGVAASRNLTEMPRLSGT